MKYLEQLPKLLLVMLFLKGLVIGFDLYSCVVVAVLSILTAFYEYKTKELKLEQIESELQALKNSIIRIEEKTNKINDSVTGFKMAQGMKVKF